jgi:hypothetical protein
MASSSKRQTTMAKIQREQAVKAKRARKQEKKEDRKLAAAAGNAEPRADEAVEDEVEAEATGE